MRTDSAPSSVSRIPTRFLFGILVVAGWVGLGCSAEPPGSEPPKQDPTPRAAPKSDPYQKLRSLMKESRFKEAEQLATTLLEKRVEDPELYTWRARARGAQAGRLEDAVNDLERALEVDPNNPDRWYERARPRVATGDIEGARANLKKALELKPKHIESLLALGVLSKHGGATKSALEYFAKAHQFASANLQAHKLYAEELQKVGRTDDAEKEARSIVEKHPKKALGYAVLTQIYLFQNDEDKVRETVSRGIELAKKDRSPDLAILYGTRGTLRWQADAWEPGAKDLNEAVAISSQFDRTALRQSLAQKWLIRLGFCLEQAECEPKTYGELVGSSVIRMSRGDVETATARLDKAIAMNPDCPEAHFWKGQRYLLASKAASSIDYFRRAIKLDPWDARAYFGFAMGYKGLRTWGTTREIVVYNLRMAVALDPTCKQYRTELRALLPDPQTIDNPKVLEELRAKYLGMLRRDQPTTSRIFRDLDGVWKPY